MTKHIHIHLNKTKDEKEKTPQDIIDYMVKHGSNKIDAEKLVKKHFNYVVKQYSNSPVSKMAEVIGYLSMHDKKAKDTDYSKWYNAELAQELRWDVKTYPKGMKVKARRGDKSGNWIVDFPDGTRNGMREAELKFNEPVKDSTEGSLFHAGQIASAIRLIEAKKDLSQPEKQMLIAVVKRMSLSEVSKHLQALKSGKSKDARGVTPESLAKAKEKASRILQILSSSSAASNLIQGDLDEAQRGLNNALNWLN